ncbi:conserved hypothetical protein [Gloeothece citriformis PCC 7424]|uniref:DUF3011 domain-containing protein n=1 Tax=Gloeothece citriformis (strain PCC 7424) TaxID=65393 RepID=B7KJZ2_GLOC7|nr:DUF3011 domain-containing protein [Gloeothece citriformis]ACK69591.1 conserved hypothetical protein [Gloeothece citriformis PCC 7424]
MLKQTLSLSSVLFLLLGSNLIFNSVAAADNIVTCESKDGRTQRCPMNTRGGVELIDQLSDGSCRGRWSYGRGYVEVRDGCRARFVSDGEYYDQSNDNQNRERITCSSKRGETERCRFDARGGIRLVRQLSNTSCEGNWSYRNGYVIVRDGCRAEFETRRR